MRARAIRTRSRSSSIETRTRCISRGIRFRRDFLATFARLESTPLETAESIDMLRALEHGYRVRMARTAHATSSVDTPADLDKVATLMGRDPLLCHYGGI